MEGVYYLVKYTPAVSWIIARLMMSLSINKGWATREVDLYNAFVQAALVEDVELTCTSNFN